MSLAKIAQLSSLDKDLLYITDEDLSVSDEHDEKHEHSEPAGEIVILKVDEDEPVEEKEISFELPLVPGGDHQDDIVDENELKVEEDEDKVEVADLGLWDWKGRGIKAFPTWLKNMMDNPPKHSGMDTVGLERCIAYFKKLDGIISTAVRTDLDGELNIGMIEKAREEIHKAIGRLEERYGRVNGNKFKKKKKADEEEGEGFVKEAQKASKFVVTVSLLESHIARVCINAVVSAGKSMEDTFQKLATKYKLSDRERISVISLIGDMGYPIRIREADFNENFDPTSPDNIETIQQFYS